MIAARRRQVLSFCPPPPPSPPLPTRWRRRNRRPRKGRTQGWAAPPGPFSRIRHRTWRLCASLAPRGTSGRGSSAPFSNGDTPCTLLPEISVSFPPLCSPLLSPSPAALPVRRSLAPETRSPRGSDRAHRRKNLFGPFNREGRTATGFGVGRRRRPTAEALQSHHGGGGKLRRGGGGLRLRLPCGRLHAVRRPPWHRRPR